MGRGIQPPSTPHAPHQHTYSKKQKSPPKNRVFEFYLITSDAGSQYRCGRVGRGIQPPSTPQTLPSHTQTYTKRIKNAHFSTFQLDHHGRTDGRKDGRTDVWKFTRVLQDIGPLGPLPKKYLKRSTFQLDHHGPTDRRTNGRTKPLIELRVRN